MPDLEREESKEIEQEKQTPEVERADTTQPEEKPTVSITETPEFKKSLGKALESTNRQFTLAKKESDAAKAEVERIKADMVVLEAGYQDLQKMHDELVGKQFAEDPEARQAYINKKAMLEEKRQIAKDKAEAERKLYEAEKLVWATSLAKKSADLVKETGIDPAELEDCATEEEMEVKALRFKLKKGEPEKEPKKPPKFDSGVSTGGVNLKDLSPDEKVNRGLEKLKNR